MKNFSRSRRERERNDSANAHVLALCRALFPSSPASLSPFERERESIKNRKAPRVTRENFYPKKKSISSSIKRDDRFKAAHTRVLCNKEEEDEEDEKSRTVFEDDDDEEDVIVAHLETDCIIIAFFVFMCVFVFSRMCHKTKVTPSPNFLPKKRQKMKSAKAKKRRRRSERRKCNRALREKKVKARREDGTFWRERKNFFWNVTFERFGPVSNTRERRNLAHTKTKRTRARAFISLQKKRTTTTTTITL